MLKSSAPVQEQEEDPLATMRTTPPRWGWGPGRDGAGPSVGRGLSRGRAEAPGLTRHHVCPDRAAGPQHGADRVPVPGICQFHDGDQAPALHHHRAG